MPLHAISEIIVRQQKIELMLAARIIRDRHMGLSRRFPCKTKSFAILEYEGCSPPPHKSWPKFYDNGVTGEFEKQKKQSQVAVVRIVLQVKKNHFFRVFRHPEKPLFYDCKSVQKKPLDKRRYPSHGILQPDFFNGLTCKLVVFSDIIMLITFTFAGTFEICSMLKKIIKTDLPLH